MDDTVLCALDEGPSAASVTAFGVWMSECIGARPRVCSSSSPEELLAVASEHDARMIVIASPGDDDPSRSGHALVRGGFRGVVVEMSPKMVEDWRDPAFARERTRTSEVLNRVAHAAFEPGGRVAG